MSLFKQPQQLLAVALIGYEFVYSVHKETGKKELFKAVHNKDCYERVTSVVKDVNIWKTRYSGGYPISIILENGEKFQVTYGPLTFQTMDFDVLYLHLENGQVSFILEDQYKILENKLLQSYADMDKNPDLS